MANVLVINDPHSHLVGSGTYSIAVAMQKFHLGKTVGSQLLSQVVTTSLNSCSDLRRVSLRLRFWDPNILKSLVLLAAMPHLVLCGVCGRALPCNWSHRPTVVRLASFDWLCVICWNLQYLSVIYTLYNKYIQIVVLEFLVS